MQPADAQMTRFATNTKVPSERSQEEIRRVVKKYGAKSFGSFEDGDKAIVLFETQDRRVRFTLALPIRGAREFAYSRVEKVKRSERTAELFWEQACRQRWRALLLAIKAKLESVEAGIESFDEAFLSHIILHDGQTVYEQSKELLALSCKQSSSKPLPPLLAGPT